MKFSIPKEEIVKLLCHQINNLFIISSEECELILKNFEKAIAKP